MRSEKALIEMLNKLVKLLSEESSRNPEFADRLETLLAPLPAVKTVQKRRPIRLNSESVPDIHSEFASRGESEFRLWLRDQPMDVLRALIKTHDFDATGRTAKWKDPEKLSGFIADKTRSRLARGSSFLTDGESS